MKMAVFFHVSVLMTTVCDNKKKCRNVLCFYFSYFLVALKLVITCVMLRLPSGATV